VVEKPARPRIGKTIPADRASDSLVMKLHAAK